MDHCTELQAQTAMGGQEGIASNFGAHLAIAQDEMWQDRENRSARGTLDPPDGDPAQPDPYIMGVTRQAPAPATGRLVGELKPKREDERQDELDKRFAIAEYLEVGRFIAEINGDSAIVVGRLGAVSHVSPSVEMAIGVDETS